MLFTPIQILDVSIKEEIIYIIFVVLAGIALFLFVFSLIFKKARTKQSTKLSNEEQAKKMVFEKEMNDVENEVNLILVIQTNPEKVQERRKEK